MALAYSVSARIAKPLPEVFDAVVNPEKLDSYFTTVGGASAPLVAGTTVTWWGSVPVDVSELIPHKRIVLRWDQDTAGSSTSGRLRVVMEFEPLDDDATLVTIAEDGWPESEDGQRGSYGNCEGWTQMLCCMKAYLEYGINLRAGYYPSELQGEAAVEPR